MAVKSHEVVINFGKGNKSYRLVLKAGKKDDEVTELQLGDVPGSYDGIEIDTSKSGKNKQIIKESSYPAWEKAKKYIRVVEEVVVGDKGNSGDAVCFETPMGWFCIE